MYSFSQEVHKASENSLFLAVNGLVVNCSLHPPPPNRVKRCLYTLQSVNSAALRAFLGDAGRWVERFARAARTTWTTCDPLRRARAIRCTSMLQRPASSHVIEYVTRFVPRMLDTGVPRLDDRQCAGPCSRNGRLDVYTLNKVLKMRCTKDQVTHMWLKFCRTTPRTWIFVTLAVAIADPFMEDKNTQIRKLKELVASLEKQLQAAEDPAGSLIRKLDVHDLVAAPADMHGYYAIHMVCTKGGVRHHVIYIGHQRGPGGKPEYAEAIGRIGNSGPGHHMWKFVPGELRKYYEMDFRMDGEPVLVRSGYGMETVITRHLQLRLPSATVKVAESARACSYYSVSR